TLRTHHGPRPAEDTGYDTQRVTILLGVPCVVGALPHCGGPGTAVAPSRPGVSGRISIFQPVSRAARRAFCPSLPIASESWYVGTTTRADLSASTSFNTQTTRAGTTTYT